MHSVRASWQPRPRIGESPGTGAVFVILLLVANAITNPSNRTSHDDAYGFNEFVLSTCEQVGFGWAFWDFDSTNPRGGGAFIDNDREGATHDEYEGYLLDRNILFQAY